VDSRPEIGVVSDGLVYMDINGNMLWDPTGKDNDFTNRDLVFQFGFPTDRIFAGQFTRVGGVNNGFDRLGAYGAVRNAAGQLVYSFALDTTDDGVADFASVMPNHPHYQVNGTPVAGNFSDAKPGDEIGLFDGRFWYLDTNGNNQIDIGERMEANYTGLPIVGDFNGDGRDDLATFDPATNSFFFDTNRDGRWNYRWEIGSQLTRFMGMTGFTAIPIAGDYNLDGIDDIGLWVKGRNGVLPRNSGEVFLWISDQRNVNPALVFNAFSPAPLGNDLYAQFGDELALPVFGNFDPPVGDAPLWKPNLLHRESNPFDVDGDGMVTPLDVLAVVNFLNAPMSLPWDDPVRALALVEYRALDVDGDRQITPLDVLMLVNELNRGSSRGLGAGEGEASLNWEESPETVDLALGEMGWFEFEEISKRRKI
jgi:hypothetical protein